MFTLPTFVLIPSHVPKPTSRDVGACLETRGWIQPSREIILADEHLGKRQGQLNKPGVLAAMKAWNYSNIP